MPQCLARQSRSQTCRKWRVASGEWQANKSSRAEKKFGISNPDQGQPEPRARSAAHPAGGDGCQKRAILAQGGTRPRPAVLDVDWRRGSRAQACEGDI